MSDRYQLKLGRQYPGTKDTLDVRLYMNNWLGVALVLCGFGIRASVRLRDVRPIRKKASAQ